MIVGATESGEKKGEGEIVHKWSPQMSQSTGRASGAGYGGFFRRKEETYLQRRRDFFEL